MSLEEIAGKIENMEIRGAAKIARSAAQALKEFCEGYEGTEEEFFEKLVGAAQRLIETRPLAPRPGNTSAALHPPTELLQGP